ncbi:Retrovirus-related Pol polyprotein from transposon 17.6 [Vitis vinifera]|uniref:Retrovirus-related Pol polyprotein from transposon 17.6 n=1 Tax=Vitis vinifera TaxID=29760 RepID=A0A438BLC4_VITVI|nr:Retrovirus-related Pol polyprotein from transposon 17.6 [Vitis vinifera]
MDLSIFEYLPTSCDNIYISAPYSLTPQILDIDDEFMQPDSDKDSFDYDSDSIDERVLPTAEDVETVDFGTEDQPRELKIGSPLSTDERDILIHLLRLYLDVFAWSYEDMPGLDPSIVQHHLPILPHVRPVKQKLRRLHPRWSLQVKEEIQKQLSVGFISIVEYPEWLADVVPIPKKDGKVRVCVDFKDLNKAIPKDDFPLPHINLLVDSTAGHSMLSFMDGFSGYNQTLMAPEDMEKIAFITEWGTYCYRVMPFGLKNAGATYQRAATTLFHDMMHKDVEVYVDDMIVKSRGRADHLAALKRFFERIQKFRLRLNPKKCTFGVTSGKLLGHMVSDRGIEVNPDKIKAILDMPVSRTEKEIRGFLGSLQYISRFIARLTDIFSDMALGCMLAQLDDSGKERAIYYLSKRMLEYEMRYVMIERMCLALVWVTRRLRHYMIEYFCVLDFSVRSFEKSIKGSIVVDHLTSLPISEGRPVDDDFPDEEFIAMTSLLSWRMYFDDRHPATNNIVEYEACILGLETTLELGIRQIQRNWNTRDVKLRPYHAYLELLVGRFDDLRYTRLPRAQNQFADALATLASSVDIPIDVVICPLLIESRFTPAYCCLIGETETQDDLPWYHDIYQLLRSSIYPEATTAKDHRAMREVHAGVCGPHMGGHMLARKIMRTGYFWMTMETDCCRFVQRCPECQTHGDLIHAPPSELHALTSPWPFSVWGIDIIGKVSPKSSSGHEFILIAIDYFTKWVEATSYAKLTSARVASFIR